MKFDEQRTIICPTVTQSVMIVSDVRFIRESLSAVLVRVSASCLSCTATDLADTRSAVMSGAPDIILLDVAVAGGLQMVVELRRLCPGTSIVALGLRERDEDVLTWAEAGIVGYVPNTSSISEMLNLIDQIGRGEQTCSARIAGTLLRRIAWSDAKAASPDPSSSNLTRREVQVLDLVNAGFSNKDIARRLDISVSTAKTHVHHLLGKLNMTRRANVMVGMRVGTVPGRGGASP
jgi:two-component system nitrate/nitrite response regulator NarL